MRVLQVHTAYREPGGEDVVVADEAAALRAAGHEVVQRIAANPEGAAAALRALATAPWRPAAARAARDAVGAFRPDLAAVHNTWFALSPAVVHALGDAHVPVVLTLHQYRLICPAGTLFHHGRPCTDCVGSHPWHAVRHRCYRDSAVLSGVAAATVESWQRSGALDAVDRFVVMTEAGRELFTRAGLPADRIAVRAHGVADPGVGPTPPSTSRTLVYAGRAVEEKGLGALLAWWAERPRALELAVLGDGPVLDRWRDRVPPGVELRGAQPRPAVLEAMRTARAVVVPSLWPEPFGLVAVEAMASGRGVASTGVGGLADIHGDGGWAATAADPDQPFDRAAWDVLLDRLADDDEVDRVGALARSRYLDRFTPAEASRTLLALYDDVLGGRGEGPGGRRGAGTGGAIL